MTEIGANKWRIIRFVMMMLMNCVLASMFASAERSVTMIEEDMASVVGYGDESKTAYFWKLANSLFQTDGSGYHHVWPEMKLGWKIVLGAFIGFCGAAFGSVGGVGGGGIFVPMLTLIIGFDAKSATAISKCMIMGAAASTVLYNLKLRHPTLDMPIIDYDLALLIQPMLMLGISIGVSFNVIFADWMVTVLLIILFIGTSTKAFCRGVDTWKKETIMKKEAAKRLETNGDGAEAEYKLLPGGPSNGTKTKPDQPLKEEVGILENVCWKELGLLVFVWVAFLGLQIGKIPISFGVSGYEAVCLYRGSRIISSKGDSSTTLGVGQLILYCLCGIIAGLVGGLLGLGGGFIMGPLFLELGVPPQVSSATATFAMTFSSSMSVVEYYLLKRFPVPYGLGMELISILYRYFTETRWNDGPEATSRFDCLSLGCGCSSWLMGFTCEYTDDGVIVALCYTDFLLCSPFFLVKALFSNSVHKLSSFVSSMFASAERIVTTENVAAVDGDETRKGHSGNLANYLFQTNGSGYHHVWPEMELGWRIVVGSFIGFCGGAFGSIGGVGGGGIFVPMLTLIIGFDPKSATAVSKCMVMGAAASTAFYNLKLRHPTLDMPIIDYDLALLIQPMLMLGISIGVVLNLIFADWMVTVLLIILFLGTSIKAFGKGVDTWKKETIMKKEAAKRLETNGNGAEPEYKLLPGGPSNGTKTKGEQSLKQEVSIVENVRWKELGLLVLVWVAFLALQIGKVPVSFAVSGFEAVCLYKGSRSISSKGDSSPSLGVGQLALYCSCGIIAEFLENVVQVSSATTPFVITFASSMAVIEYYLLKRFPIPYAVFFFIVATIAALFGQHVGRKLVMSLGRVSLIIFILAFTVLISAISLGGVGIANMIGKFERHEYMGFENLCLYDFGIDIAYLLAVDIEVGFWDSHVNTLMIMSVVANDGSLGSVSCSQKDNSSLHGECASGKTSEPASDVDSKQESLLPHVKDLASDIENLNMMPKDNDSKHPGSVLTSEYTSKESLTPYSQSDPSHMRPIRAKTHSSVVCFPKEDGIRESGEQIVEADSSERPEDSHPIMRFDICPKRCGFKLNTSLFAKNKERRNQLKRTMEGQNIKILRPGMVLMKGYISCDEQISIVQTCRELGIGDGGFYQPGYRDGSKLHLKMMCLGKNWDPQTSEYSDTRPVDNSKPPGIPDKFHEMVKKAIQDANAHIQKSNSKADAGNIIPSMLPDICIVNFYSKNGKLGLHQDKDESSESINRGLPVVSFSIGQSADFLYGDVGDIDKATKVVLESGDVLIFGGKSRRIFHGVTSIHPNEAPSSVQEATNMIPGRLNLTFRQF
ncbi:hypothetical protein OSB04_013794 [Centaurea solstitialis]|uniref:DNA N(6)-methyladenine demethylase n=1 Tax=Centaurea solstitialis TaxID=347529 RepID=A0AA38TQL6_9ASTR|nr:hypothetical protein OSB04_013794 [Centaurea solstitialis]